MQKDGRMGWAGTRQRRMWVTYSTEMGQDNVMITGGGEEGRMVRYRLVVTATTPIVTVTNTDTAHGVRMLVAINDKPFSSATKSISEYPQLKNGPHQKIWTSSKNIQKEIRVDISSSF